MFVVRVNGYKATPELHQSRSGREVNDDIKLCGDCCATEFTVRDLHCPIASFLKTTESFKFHRAENHLFNMLFYSNTVFCDCVCFSYLPKFPSNRNETLSTTEKTQTKYLQAHKHWCIQQTSKQEHPWCTDVMTKQPHNLKCQKKTSTASAPNGDDIVLDTSRSQSKDYIWSNIDIAFS